MADLKEARVPDIGHEDVPVIEVLVKAGDRVEKEQGLITLESDKATMEVPSPFAGTVKEMKLKVGDEVSEGAVIALIDGRGGNRRRSRLTSPLPRRGQASGASRAAADEETRAAPPAEDPSSRRRRAGPAEQPSHRSPARACSPATAPEGDVPPSARPPWMPRS